MLTLNHVWNRIQMEQKVPSGLAMSSEEMNEGHH